MSDKNIKSETGHGVDAQVSPVSSRQNDDQISSEKSNDHPAEQSDSGDSRPRDNLHDEEKPPFLFTVTDKDGETEAIPDDDPRVKDIPPYVRRIVSLTDDPTLPTITFRYFLLTIIFVVPGAFLSQMSRFRTTYAPYSVFFVQIASSYLGAWLARVLPAWNVRVPLTKWSFSLNPGPFSVKEHVLVTIAAASGATYNLGYTPVSMSEVYLGEAVNPAVAIFFMWAIVWIGYSYAAIARQFLIYDPQFPWFYSLCQTALFETQKKQREHPTALTRKQTRVFFLVLLGVVLWQFLPEYAFPMLGSMAFLCWVAPHNPTANFIGSGFGGMGFLNLSFDWSSISSSLFLTPWWTQVIQFIGFALSCWVLLPAAKWGDIGTWKHHLMSNRLFLSNGTRYPLNSLMNDDFSFNEEAYEELGHPYVGAQVLWSMFFDYASYTSALVWMALFGYGQLKESLTKLWARRKSGSREISEQYTDQLSILQRSYKEVPIWWYVALFAFTFIVLVTITASGHLFIPVWTTFVAMATGAIVVTPLGWLYALSNFQLAIGSTNELLYGLMVNAVAGYKNPAGASVYGSIAGDAWYRAQLQLQDMKIGHYMHVPPKAVFFSQIFGSFIGVPINYAVVKWVISSKFDYITGAVDDPTHQWTGQELASSLTLGVQYVLLGPKRLFEIDMFRPVPYGFLLGLVAPFFVFALHRLFPKIKFRLFNTTILFSTMSGFYGNISTGYFSSLLGGFVVMFWAYRNRYEMWARWNYILAAAFDAGFNFNMLLIFLFFGAGKVISMPNWWGNDADSSEKCYALDDS